MEEYQIVISIVDINNSVTKGTIGVILVVLDADNYIVEFINEKNETLDNGMTTVNANQITTYERALAKPLDE